MWHGLRTVWPVPTFRRIVRPDRPLLGTRPAYRPGKDLRRFKLHKLIQENASMLSTVAEKGQRGGGAAAPASPRNPPATPVAPSSHRGHGLRGRGQDKKPRCVAAENPLLRLLGSPSNPSPCQARALRAVRGQVPRRVPAARGHMEGRPPAAPALGLAQAVAAARASAAAVQRGPALRLLRPVLRRRRCHPARGRGAGQPGRPRAAALRPLVSAHRSPLCHTVHDARRISLTVPDAAAAPGGAAPNCLPPSTAAAAAHG